MLNNWFFLRSKVSLLEEAIETYDMENKKLKEQLAKAKKACAKKGK